jgi:transposase
MAKPYADDLRRKFLAAYEVGDRTLEELAGDFGVSLGWAKKVSSAYTRTGMVERRVHRPGRKAKVDDEQRKQLLKWVAAEPDLTLVQLQVKLAQHGGAKVSLACIWRWLKRLRLRLKKSHSTQPSGTLKRTASGAGSLSRSSEGST